MKVPRGTSVGGRVRPLVLAKFERAALGYTLRALRFPVDANNSTVHPGSFDGLDLGSGRARMIANQVEIRARCTFANGGVRAVRVAPAIERGDLFWVRGGALMRRDESKWTLQVTRVGVARLQDMRDEDASALGAGYFLHGAAGALAPRATYRNAWDHKHRRGPEHHRWAWNPWVWIVHFDAHDVQVDKFLERGRR